MSNFKSYYYEREREREIFLSIGPQGTSGWQGPWELHCSAEGVRPGWLSALPSQAVEPSRMEMTQPPWAPAPLPGCPHGQSLISSLSLSCLAQPQHSSFLNNLVLKLKGRHSSLICVADLHINLYSPFMCMLFSSHVHYRVGVEGPSPMTENLLAATHFSFLRLLLLTKWSPFRLPQKESKVSMIQSFGCMY